VQKQRIGENVQVVVQALKKMEADIRSRYDEVGNKIEKRVATIKDGQDGRNGVNGKDGKDGRPGRDGGTGPRGADGLNGRDGRDGDDGVSVTDAHIDFDGSLIISLSSGRTINVGEVVAPDLAEKIKVITNGGGTSQQVLDTLASLQTQIDNLIPDQTGNAGKFLTTNGSALSWGSAVGGLSYEGTWNASTNTPTLASGTGTNGYYYVVATAGSTNLDGITDWQIGDWLIFNGTVWQKIDQSNLVTSVNGQTGAVSLSTTNISEGTNQYYTDARARAAISAGTGISYDSSTGVVTNSAPDQTVALTAGTGISTSGTYPNFTITNAAPDQTVALTAGTGISTSGTYPNFTITNAAPDQTVALTGSGTTTVTGTYPNFTIASDDQYDGTVTSVGGTGTVNGISLSGTVTSSGNLTLGGTLDLSSPPAIGGTTAAAVSATTLTTSSTVTHNGGTANGVTYLNGSKVLTTGSALTFDGTNLGIGTSSPSAKLDVSGGNLRLTNASNAKIELRTSGNNATSELLLEAANSSGTTDQTASIKAVGSGGTDGGANLTFATKDRFGVQSERARIDSSGNLLVGTTSAGGHVSINSIGGSQGTALFVNGWGGGIGSGAVFTAANTSNADAIYFNTSTTNVGKIAITSTATSYVTSSDYRLKEDVAPMTGALSVVQQLKPCTYKWKADGSDGQGFIAHELQAVVPDCVTGEKDAVDAEGKPVYQGIDTSFLVATLTAAIQELKAEFDAYKATHP
jgi:hypothetical protein